MPLLTPLNAVVLFPYPLYQDSLTRQRGVRGLGKMEGELLSQTLFALS